MRKIKTYNEILESEILDKFKDEVNDYLINLKDNGFTIESKYFHTMDGYLYVCNISNKKYTFEWKQIKNDIHQYVEMSKFKLKFIKVTPIIYNGDYNTYSLSKIPDMEELSDITLYLDK